MRDAPGEQIGHHGRDAAIGHVLDVDARHGLEQFAGEMLRGADAGRAEGELAGLRARIGDELGHALHRQVGRHRQQVRRVDDLRDRREVLHRIERELLVEARIGDDGGGGGGHQRVAVGRRLGDAIGRDIAGRAGHVLDDHRLAPGLGDLVADERAP